MQSVLRYPIDDRTLVPAKRLTLLVKFRLGVCLELLKDPFIATEQVAIYPVVGDIQRQRVNIGHVDEWELLVLELTGQYTPLFEPILFRTVCCELDSDIKI